MHVVEWSKPARHFPQSEIDDFYHRPLDAPTVFRFETSKMELPAHGGAFSLKTVLTGEEHYNIGSRSITLRPGELMFVNAGESYSSRIEKETKSISIFTPPKDASDLISSAKKSLKVALDEPQRDSVQPEITQIPFRARLDSMNALSQLGKAIDNGDHTDIIERTRTLLDSALQNLFHASPPAPLRQLKKRSTRDELRLRVLRAKTLIDDTQGAFCDLDGLSAEACLSKYHFMRMFGEIYGISPAAYARRLRFQAARQAIKRGEDISLAARRAGFHDLRAFRRAYCRYFNVSIPSPS